MAVKPIIEIELDDSAFRRFYELFQTYSAQLDEMPKAWSALNEQMGQSGGALRSGALDAKNMLAIAAAQAGVISEELGKATKAQNHLSQATHKGAKNMEALKKGAHGVSQALSLIGGGLVKIAAFGGLGALLGGFGIDSLAATAFSRFRSAGQLGISPGLLASFQVNAQQFLGTSALEAAANAQIDVQKAGALAALGINFGQAQRMNPADLAFEELKRARSAYLLAEKNHQTAANMPAIIAYKSLGGNIGDVRNAAMQPLSVLQAAQDATRRDVAQLGFSRATAQSWTTLKIVLDKAGLTIQSALINSLAPLAPEIGRLSKDLAGFITSVLSSKQFGGVIKDAETGLKGLATFLEKTNWKEVGADIAALGKDIVAGLRLLHLIPENHKGKTLKQMGLIDPARATAKWFAHELAILQVGNILSLGDGANRNVKDIVNAAKKLGVDPILAVSTAMQESSLNAKLHYKDASGSGSDTGLFALNSHGEGAGYNWHQLLNPKINSMIGLREFAAVDKLSPAALLNRFSKAARLADPKVTHAQIMALVGTPGEKAVVSQRPEYPIQYAEGINKYYRIFAGGLKGVHPPAKPRDVSYAPKINTLYAKLDKRLRLLQKPVHVTIHNATAHHLVTSAHATAQ